MSNSNEKTAVEKAISLASDLGWKIHPLQRGGKVPLGKWRETASSDPDVLKDLFRGDPSYNYGIVTGPESCIVLDVDVKNGQPGLESLSTIFTEEEIADMVICDTPSGGLHLYFSSHDSDGLRNRAGFMPGLDLRGEGGYIVGPGSRTLEGEYKLRLGCDLHNLPMIPDKLRLQLIAPKRDAFKSAMMVLTDESSVIQEGGRNETLFRVACVSRDSGMVEADCLTELFAINESRCSPPLDEEEVRQCVSSAYTKGRDIVSYLDRFDATEKGMSELFLDRNSDDVIYVPEYKSYAYWRNPVWAMDSSLFMQRKVKELTDLYREAQDTCQSRAAKAKQDGDERSEAKWNSKASMYSGLHRKSGTRNGMANVLEIAKSEVVVNLEKLDSDPMILAVQNGVVDLTAGTFRPEADKAMNLTMMSPVCFDREAECPQWREFIRQCTLDDQELADYLQKMVGYMLTGLTSEQVLFFLHGLGANGKSTFINVVQRILGGYQRAIPAASLMVKNGGSSGAPNPDIAMLRGKRMVVSSELEEGERLSESLVKSLTGGDTITARHLYGEFFEFTPSFKLVMVGNHRPHIRGSDHGIWRRIRLIPFSNNVPAEQRDPGLESKLLEELPGILNWAIEGCLSWQAGGLGVPEKVRQETEEYRDSEDIMKRFISDSCTLAPQVGAYQKHLYRTYCQWALENNEWTMSNKQFGNKLKEQGLRTEKKSAGMYWGGITPGSGAVMHWQGGR